MSLPMWEHCKQAGKHGSYIPTKSHIRVSSLSGFRNLQQQAWLNTAGRNSDVPNPAHHTIYFVRTLLNCHKWFFIVYWLQLHCDAYFGLSITAFCFAPSVITGVPVGRVGGSICLRFSAVCWQAGIWVDPNPEVVVKSQTITGIPAVKCELYCAFVF